ncbi:cupredoxin domain-containing protein [Candidatus Leptofilum sp.]|uniref:cupredoxin domain-containing protein n=1 Tax=Candidatus Leptofilum sp. TaxID=3241576 RepID=UPI003B59763D
MQVTTTVQEKENSWLNYLVLLGGILVGIVLFGLVIARMGLLNDLLGGRSETAVSPSAIHYTSENMRFGQDVLRVQAGEAIAFALDNKDTYAHSFDIDELDWHVHMPANEQVMAEFTAVPPGTYAVYCGIPGHREAGMVATLIVEE